MTAATVTAAGPAELSIGLAADGIVGRGVLLDVPRSRGVSWLEPGDHVTVADVLASEQDQQVRIGQGDIVLVRVGHRRWRNEQGPWDAAETRAGLHPTGCRDWPSAESPPWAAMATTTRDQAQWQASTSRCTPGRQRARPGPAGLFAVHRAQSGVRGDPALVVPVHYCAAAGADRNWVAGSIAIL